MSTEREKTGVFIGAYAVNPMTERADPDLDRGLRAARLWDGRDHGRPRARRARLRVRRDVRPADPLRGGAAIGRAAGGRGFRGAHRATRCWSTPANSPACPPRRRSRPSPQQLADLGPGGPRRHLPAPGLAGQPPALLGLPRSPSSTATSTAHSRCRRTSSRCCCRPTSTSRRPACRRSSPTPAFLAADLPGLRRTGAPRDRHHGHLRRLGVVFPALLLAAQRRSPGTRRRCATGCRSTCTPAASEHAVLHLHVFPLLREGAARHGTARHSTSRSWRCATRARSWAPITSG